MRLRNVKNKNEILNSTDLLITEPFSYIGKWKDYFKNDNPIYIEVGMGKGNFIIQSALKNPGINYVGIEKYDSVIARAVEKIPNDIHNLVLIRMNAIDIDKVFSNEVECIYLNFSDPWPKERHYKRRLTSEIFLNKYDSIFKNDKLIVQKTDNKELFEYSIVSLSNNGYILCDISLDLHSRDKFDNIMTEYEEKFVLDNKKIYYLVAKK